MPQVEKEESKFLAFTPQLIISLSHDGNLQFELPGAFASRRKIILRDSKVVETLKRILAAQAQGLTPDEIGQDSAPTEAQVKHWERHGNFPDSRCRFCLAEQRRARGGKKKKLPRVIVNDSGIRIRVMPAERSANSIQQCQQTTDELGL